MQVHPLQGGLAIDPHGGNLAVFNRWLAADRHQIAVMDLRLHAAALAGQGKRCPPLGGHADHALNVFLCCDGLAAGDPTNQRHLCHGGHWLKSRRDLRLIFERNRLIPVQHGYYIIKIHVDCLCHRFDRLK